MGEVEATPKAYSLFSAFVGMVLSGLLSLGIAFSMYMVGEVSEARSAADQRRGLVQFLALEALEVYEENMASAERKVVDLVDRRIAVPILVNAISLGQAVALKADPDLVIAVRSVYGRHARLERDLSSFDRRKLRVQIQSVTGECTGLTEDVARIIEIAEREGVDPARVAHFRERHRKAASLMEKMIAECDRLYPLVQVTESLGPFSLRGEKTWTVVVNNRSPDRPLAVIGATTALAGVRIDLPEGAVVGPEERLEIPVTFVSAGMPTGDFEGEIVITTDCPGFEHHTVSVQGTARE